MKPRFPRALCALCVLCGSLLLASCTSTKAAYQRGLFAGESAARINQNQRETSDIGRYWLNVAKQLETANHRRAAAEQLANAQAISDPAIAAAEAFDIGAKAQADLAASEAVRQSELANLASHDEAGAQLAETPKDVSNMADLEATLPNRVLKHAIVSTAAAAGPLISAAAAKQPAPAPTPVPPSNP